MVNKLWFRELARKWFQARFEPPHARCFSEPRCQDELRAWYLLYRWLIFTLWLAIVVCSVFEVGSAKPLYAWDKWPIYLTNWDLLLGLVQSLLGVVLVTRRWRQQCRPGFETCQLRLGPLERAYWFLYVAVSSMAPGVTVTYWLLVHDPSIHQVDPLNLLIHVCNTVLMLADLCVAGVPFELRCFWWAPAVTGLYVLFSLVYYAAGGLDKRGSHRIYNVLDWERPGRTLLVCAGGLVFLVVLHCLLYLLARARDRLLEGRAPAAKKQESFRPKGESCV